MNLTDEAREKLKDAIEAGLDYAFQALGESNLARDYDYVRNISKDIAFMESVLKDLNK